MTDLLIKTVHTKFSIAHGLHRNRTFQHWTHFVGVANDAFKKIVKRKQVGFQSVVVVVPTRRMCVSYIEKKKQPKGG